MKSGNLDRLYLLSVLLLGGALLVSCSAAGQPPAVPDSNSEPLPTRSIEGAVPSASVSCENVTIANPAATYCAMLGYQSGTQETAAGQASTCIMPDGTVCDAWQFLRGTCGQEFSWCALNGYQIQNVVESDGSSTQEYAVCVDASGNTVGTLFELSGLQALLDNCLRR